MVQKIDRIFARFWPPIFFEGSDPEVLDLHYKIEPVSDHVAKFRGDRLRDLGDYALNKKENITSKTEDLPYYRTGRSKKGRGLGHGAGIKCEMRNAKVRILQCVKCEIKYEIIFTLYTCIQTMTVNRRWIKCELRIEKCKNHYLHLCCNYIYRSSMWYSQQTPCNTKTEIHSLSSVMKLWTERRMNPHIRRSNLKQLIKEWHH